MRSTSYLALLALMLFGFGIAITFGCSGDDDDDSASGDDDNDNDNDDDSGDDDAGACDCEIDGECYGNGETNPDNGCYICDKSQSVVAWSFNNGGSCDDGLFCNGADTCDDNGNCSIHAGFTCEQDDLFCNGQKICDESTKQCIDGDSCDFSESYCDEDADQCVDVNCEELYYHYYNCGYSIKDGLGNAIPRDEAITYCQNQLPLFAPGDEYFLCITENWSDCESAKDCVDNVQ